MARCPWEAGMDLDSEEEEELVNDVDEAATDDWRKRPAVYSVDESSSGSSSSSSEEYCDSTSRVIPDSLVGIPPHSTKSAMEHRFGDVQYCFRESDALYWWTIYRLWARFGCL